MVAYDIRTRANRTDFHLLEPYWSGSGAAVACRTQAKRRVRGPVHRVRSMWLFAFGGLVGIHTQR